MLKLREIINKIKPVRRDRDIRYKIIMGTSLVLLITLMFPRGKSYQFADLKEGTISNEEIIAPFTFNINKSQQELMEDRKRAQESVPPVFLRHEEIAKEQIDRLTKFFKLVNSVNKKRLIPSSKLELLKKSLQESSLNVALSDDELSFFIEKNKFLASYQRLLINIVRDLFSIGILNEDKESIRGVDGKIAVKHGGNESLEDLKHYYDMDSALEEALERLKNRYHSVGDTVKVGYRVIAIFLKPNVYYDKNETQRRINKAIASVPLIKGTVLKDERIIDKHERVTKEHIEKLRSLARAKAEREALKGGWGAFSSTLGRMLFVIMSLSLLVIFLYLFRPSIFWDDKMLFLLCITMILIIFSAYLIDKYKLSEYLIPIAVASMITTIIFDSRVAFMVTLSLSLLIGGMRGNEFNIAVISIFVGTVAIIVVSLFRQRSRFASSVLFIVPAYVVSIAVLGFLQYTPLKEMLGDWFSGLINGILSPVFTYGLLMFFEGIFGVTTDMTLLELSDLNRPLLRNLAIRAPGTYHHSILVSNLAEAAAEAIGANALLAKVGSYYHDIGKMEKAEYFVENQRGGRNPHEKLSPSMSCLILVNHVRKGLELAEQYKLPPVIKDFIAQHHGTSLMSFFYQKAVEKNGPKEVNEADFRYPGPKPRTKEIGIVMLADAVEAAARSLRDPTPSRIRTMVDSIIDERFRNSELDECPLTLKDLKKIADSFQTILLGIFHARIEYPDQEETFFKKNDKKVLQS